MADVKQNGIPVPEEGTPEWLELNKMAKVAVPIVLAIFTLGRPDAAGVRHDLRQHR